MIIDLTHPITPHMPVYPGDPDVAFGTHTSHDDDGCGYSVHRLEMGTHTGTHIDAPRHALREGMAVDSASILDACVGTALVIDARNYIADGEIQPDVIECLDRTGKKASRILLISGWSDMFGRDGFFSGFPGISRDLALLLAERSIMLLGVETPSLNVADDDEIHRILLSSGIVVCECLAHPGRIGERDVFFSAAPLRLAEMDGSPVRAYAIV